MTIIKPREEEQPETEADQQASAEPQDQQEPSPLTDGAGETQDAAGDEPMAAVDETSADGDRAAAAAEANDGEQTAAADETGNGGDSGIAATVGMTGELTFDPRTITISTGDTVRWENVSEVPHTVTADEDKANDPSDIVLPDGAEPFDSGFIGPEGTYDKTFTVPGRHKYFCIPHEAQGMIGEVIVE